MSDFLAVVEKIYALRFYCWSRRFFLPTVLFVVSVLYVSLDIGQFFSDPLYRILMPASTILTALVLLGSATVQLPHEKRWLVRVEKLLDACAYDRASQLLMASPWLLGFAARVNQKIVLIRLKIDTGDLLAAYRILTATEQTVLLPNERLLVLLSKAQVMLHAGNYAAFDKLLAEIDATPPANGKARIRHLLLKSTRFELAGSYADAKLLIEEVTALAASHTERIIAYNNLARLEDIQGNQVNAQSYYEQAWKQLQASPVPALYPSVGHNLLIKYARNNDEAKALALLDIYRSAVSPDNAEQQHQLLNDQVHLARQLENRPLLLDAYHRTATTLFPLVGDAQRFALAVSELRTRLNDNVDFPGHFSKTIALFGLHRNLSPVERLHVLSEILDVCQQSVDVLPDSERLSAEEMAAKALLAMEDEVDSQLHTIPAQLLALRDDWLRYKVEILKLKINQSKPATPRDLVKQLFQLILERQNIWVDKQNPVRELGALIVLCDEYTAYSARLGSEFVKAYQSQAQVALADAARILQTKWPHPSVNQYAFGVAYFYWKIGDRADLAATWLTRFNQSGLGLAHSASWLRQQHAQLTAWLRRVGT